MYRALARRAAREKRSINNLLVTILEKTDIVLGTEDIEAAGTEPYGRQKT
jgi:hypothetical protein